MFTLDQRSVGLSAAPAYPATSRAEMLHVIPFQATRDEIGLPQGQAVAGLERTCTLGRLPTSFTDHFPYHTVPRAQQAWGTQPPTVLTQAYRYSPGHHYQKSQYVFHAGNVNTSQYPQAHFYELPHEPKPTQSYIGLIGIAILSVPDKKLVLSDIYKYIMENYPYFRSRGHGWRNSIRHNLSLNECFIKSSRSSNGKGHFWAIHPANVDDFQKGDFRRRRAQRKVRKYLSRQKLKSDTECSSDFKGDDDDVDTEVLIDVEITDEEKLCEIPNQEKLREISNQENLCETTDKDRFCEIAAASVSVDGQLLNNDSGQDSLNIFEKELKDEPVETISPKESRSTTKRRGAFDMDTILSSTFPCVRRNVQSVSACHSQHEQFLKGPIVEKCEYDTTNFPTSGKM